MRSPVVLSLAVLAALWALPPVAALALPVEPPLDAPVHPVVGVDAGAVQVQVDDGVQVGVHAPEGIASTLAGKRAGDPAPSDALDASPAVRAAVGAPASAAAWGGLRWAFAGAMSLYSRITRGEALAHPVRKRLHELLHETPGLSPTELQARLDVGWGTLVHHLDRLERTGYVRTERSGHAKRYFIVGTLSTRDQEALALLRKDALEKLAHHIVQTPGRPQGEVAEALGLSRSAASKQFAQLENAGLVRREREGRTALVFPAPNLHDLLTAPGPSAHPAPTPAPPTAAGRASTGAATG